MIDTPEKYLFAIFTLFALYAAIRLVFGKVER